MYKKIAIIASKSNQKAIDKKKELVNKFGFFDITENKNKNEVFDLIIAVGGDGLILHLLHEYQNNPTPIYGLNYGTVGFLANSSENKKDILQSINEAKESLIHPLQMIATDIEGKEYNHIAVNEVSLFRQSAQSAKVKIFVNDQERIAELISDGVLVATSFGSTAYNFSVHGPIIPFGANVIALTPISPFRPRKWRGALLPSNSKVKFEIIDCNKRPTSATADYHEVRNIKIIEIYENKTISFKILFDPNHSLEERIINEQFAS
jgi:NAD+ kinase